MNKRYSLIILFWTCIICKGQNLVPNGDFELYTSCPTSFSQVNAAKFWIQPTGGTSDYNNSCALSSDVGVPQNLMGFQFAHSGNGYSGLYVWHMDTTLNYREYIEVQLMAPLVANVKYYFQMFVSLGENSLYSTDDIGAYFSSMFVNNPGRYDTLPFVPQIKNTPGNYFDTLNWTLVKGEYVAQGGELYLTIGNFKGHRTMNLVKLPISIANQNSEGAYCYVDDVCVSTDSLNCSSFPEDIDDLKNKEELSLFPNPFTDKINIRINGNKPVEINLFDITARKILSRSFISSAKFSTVYFAKGIYLYEIRNETGVIKFGKVVKE